MTNETAGPVTVLFTDLEASTQLMQRLGDEAARPLFRNHLTILGRVVGDNHGEVANMEGDGLMAVFTSPAAALTCAEAIQQAVHRENQQADEGNQLRVRVGLDVGELQRSDQGYFGTPVVRARRLCDRAGGSEIWASQLVRGLVEPLQRFTFRDLGELDLKGITEPVAACEVLWEPSVEQPSADRPAAKEQPQRLSLPPLLTGGEPTAFVGREKELEMLRECWESARAGERQLLLLAGEPGIGKTRLAAELAFVAHAEGATVLFGRADEQALISYQPFVEAVRHYLQEMDLGQLPAAMQTASTSLSSILEEAPSPRQERGDHRMVAAVTSFLIEASRSTPLVLIVDDLQWADQPTLSLIRHVARHSDQSSLLILGTYRDTELARAHPLSTMIADLRRERLVERVSLIGLEEEDVGVLVSAWAGRALPPELARALHERTEGNPFFIEEVLRHLTETGAIRELDGRLITDVTVEELGIPESLREVIGHRLSRLSDECNSVLTVASVIGREFGLDRLEQASDLTGNRLAELLEEAVAARVVGEVPQTPGRYGFSHAVIYETLYDELTTTRRVRLHGQTLQYADSNGVKLAYEVLGASGPHLVATGIGNCPAVRTRNLDIARHWDRVCRHCRLVLYDRRGVGYSAAPERGYSLLASAEDLRAVLDAAGVERCFLWGATDGGPLALAFAALYPDRVVGLILIGSTPKLTNSEDFAYGINVAVLQPFLNADDVDRGRATSELARTREGAEDARALGDVIGRVPRSIWAKFVGGVGAGDARPMLERIEAPTLIVHDPHSTYIPVEAGRYLHEHLQGSELEITEECRAPHFGESFYKRIGSFVDGVAARGAP